MHPRHVASYLLGLTALALVFSGQYVLEALSAHREIAIAPGLRGAALYFGAWAPLAWLPYRIAIRHPLVLPALPRHLAMVTFAGIACAGMQVVIRFALAQAIGWETERSLSELAASHLSLNVIVAATVACAGQAVAWQRRCATALEKPGPPCYLRHVTVLDRGKRIFVPVESIEWIGAADNYVELHTHEKCFLLREPLSRLELKLDPEVFARVHRRALVNVGRISEVIPATHGDLSVTLRSGTRISASRTYASRVRRLMHNVPSDAPTYQS